MGLWVSSVKQHGVSDNSFIDILAAEHGTPTFTSFSKCPFWKGYEKEACYNDSFGCIKDRARLSCTDR